MARGDKGKLIPPNPAVGDVSSASNLHHTHHWQKVERLVATVGQSQVRTGPLLVRALLRLASNSSNPTAWSAMLVRDQGTVFVWAAPTMLLSFFVTMWVFFSCPTPEYDLKSAHQNDYTITPTCTMVGASALDIYDQCSFSTPHLGGGLTGGQVFNKANWNVVIKFDSCWAYTHLLLFCIMHIWKVVWKSAQLLQIFIAKSFGPERLYDHSYLYHGRRISMGHSRSVPI